jgi:hypothetical protein
MQTKEEIMVLYKAAYLAANGKPCEITFERRRFSISTSRSSRPIRGTTAEVLTAIDNLNLRAKNKIN